MARRLRYARQRLARSLSDVRSARQAFRPDSDDDDIVARLERERDRSGSRFYGHPGFAILRGEHGDEVSGHDGDRGDAMARVESALGEQPSTDGDLGTPRVSDGSYGRGASGWTAVVEWMLEAAGQGVVGLLVTAPLVAAARRYSAFRRRMKERGATFLVNRAGAALVALDDVTQDASGAEHLWLEASEEISAAAGRRISELSYVGTDSWLVFLVDLDREVRHVRIVSPSGEVLGRASTPLNDFERLYLPIPE